MNNNTKRIPSPVNNPVMVEIAKYAASTSVSAPTEKTENFCKTCHWSWDCPPTYTEVKDGIVEGRLYCLHPKVLVVINEETFPQLVTTAREQKSLCGSKGRYWIPIQEMQVAPSTSSPRRYTQGTRSAPRPVQKAESLAQPEMKRKPYKVA
jgi:hypothetical protein